MDLHMDLKHKGLWKLNDPDILREGDSEFDDEFEEDWRWEMGEILYFIIVKHLYHFRGDIVISLIWWLLSLIMLSYIDPLDCIIWIS